MEQTLTIGNYQYTAHVARAWQGWFVVSTKAEFLCGCCGRRNKKRLGTVGNMRGLATARCDSCGEKNIFASGRNPKTGNTLWLTIG